MNQAPEASVVSSSAPSSAWPARKGSPAIQCSGTPLDKEAIDQALQAIVTAVRKVDEGQAGSVELAAARELVRTALTQMGAPAPALWSVETIARWLDVPVTTVKLYVITHPRFPAGLRPTGKPGGQRRWFAEDVIAFARGIEGSA